MLAQMQVADPYYRDGDTIRRDRIAELLERSPYIRRAATLEQLARSIEVDAPPFLSEVERYNKAIDAGLEREPAFGKPLKACKKFDTPAYLAIQLFPGAQEPGRRRPICCRVLNAPG
jgi:hypothetical protein